MGAEHGKVKKRDSGELGWDPLSFFLKPLQR